MPPFDFLFTGQNFKSLWFHYLPFTNDYPCHGKKLPHARFNVWVWIFQSLLPRKRKRENVFLPLNGSILPCLAIPPPPMTARFSIFRIVSSITRLAVLKVCPYGASAKTVKSLPTSSLDHFGRSFTKYFTTQRNSLPFNGWSRQRGTQRYSATSKVFRWSIFVNQCSSIIHADRQPYGSGHLSQWWLRWPSCYVEKQCHLFPKIFMCDPQHHTHSTE